MTKLHNDRHEINNTTEKKVYQIRSYFQIAEGRVLRGPIKTLEEAIKIRQSEMKNWFGLKDEIEKKIRIVEIIQKERVL